MIHRVLLYLSLTFPQRLSLHRRLGILTQNVRLEATLLHHLTLNLEQALLLTLLVKLVTVLEAAGIWDISPMDCSFLVHLPNHLLRHF